MRQELLRSKRHDRTFSLLILDIDHFKEVNDRYGHKAGDSVLTAMGSLILQMMRKTDKVFRIGGEEFAIIAPETPGMSAMTIAEKIRREVENPPVRFETSITVSVGVAELGREDTVDEIFRKADTALYQAKQAGRNRSCLSA
jgi:diguanylate cyclase (GGDEF)-like protein